MNRKLLLVRNAALIAVMVVSGCDKRSAEEPATAAPAPTPTSEPAGAAAAPDASATPTGPTAPGRPKITFTQIKHDFGTIWDFESQSCRFEFVNDGDAELVITEIKPDCGCTTTTLEKLRYAPGEGAAIEVNFDPKGRGRQRKMIAVRSNAVQPLLSLEIAAQVQQFMAFTPAVLRYGRLRMGETHTQIVQFNSVDPELVIESVTARGAHVSARLLEPEVGPATASTVRQPHEIEVTIGDRAPWGQLYGSVQVTGRGVADPGTAPVTHTQNLTVGAMIHGELVVDETIFRIGKIRPGLDFERSIRLTSVTDTPWEITQLDVLNSTLPGVEVRFEPVQIPGAEGYDIFVVGSTSGFTGQISGVVRVKTNVPGEERLDFRFAGMATEG